MPYDHPDYLVAEMGDLGGIHEEDDDDVDLVALVVCC